MRTLFLASSLALVALTGVASASSPAPRYNAGDAQLALLAGVEVGAYSRAELINILDARRDGDADKVAFYLTGANRQSTAADPAALAQLAGSAGVVAGDYSAVELQAVVDAKRENDATAVSFVLNRAAKPANPAEVVTPGEAQLAALVGVDPAQYTLAELIALQPQSDD